MARITRQKIFVGVSGGVDSSVAASLLKREGHDVHGVFIKTWAPEWLPCTWRSEKRDAIRVCAALDIPFHFLDCEAEYRKGVVEDLLNEYRAGRTPNPDVLCNRVIKFGSLWEYAQREGADAIATGHYARTDGKKLFAGLDAAKDQCYFLWMLEKKELGHIRFPIGAFVKDEVRALARRAKLFTASKKDSQGICFLGAVDMKDFLRRYIDEVPGAVLDEAGNVIGEHPGTWFFTIGERHGFKIFHQKATATPYYVLAKDISENTLTVSPRSPEDASQEKKTIKIAKENWIGRKPTGKLLAQVRYHARKVGARIVGDKVTFSENPGACVPGQSVVFYRGEECVGGAVIVG